MLVGFSVKFYVRKSHQIGKGLRIQLHATKRCKLMRPAFLVSRSLKPIIAKTGKVGFDCMHHAGNHIAYLQCYKFLAKSAREFFLIRQSRFAQQGILHFAQQGIVSVITFEREQLDSYIWHRWTQRKILRQIESSHCPISENLSFRYRQARLD